MLDTGFGGEAGWAAGANAQTHALTRYVGLTARLRVLRRFMMMVALFMRMKKPPSSSKPGSSSSHSGNEPTGPAPAIQ